jgi:hypothetical protein
MTLKPKGFDEFSNGKALKDVKLVDWGSNIRKIG